MQYLCLFNSLPHVSFLNFFCPKEEWVHFRRQNGEYILYFITEGEMYLREDGKEHVLREGDAFLLQPGLLHEGTKAARCAYYFAHFNNLSLLPFEGESDVHFLQYDEGGEAQFDMGHCLLPKHIHLYDQELRERVVQCFEDGIQSARSNEGNYRTLWAAKLLEIMLLLAQSSQIAGIQSEDFGLPARTVRKIRELKHFLNNHYMEKITGKQLEEMLEMNFDYLNRIFRKITGKTIFQYLCRVRVNRVKELLTTTDMKMAEIAMVTGYSDEFYMSRQFKKVTGISPAAYSKNGMKN